MDYQFFESLTPDGAQRFLSRFLEVESGAAEDMIANARREGVLADFQTGSLSSLLPWVLEKMKVVPLQADESLPDWIRHSSSYTDNLFDFDSSSKVLMLRSAYYLGETFVRSFKSLSWGVGNPDTAKINMPVVCGFRNNLELAPMLVLENVFGRILSGAGGSADIQEMVSYWTSKAKS